jgi:general stress protein 26
MSDQDKANLSQGSAAEKIRHIANEQVSMLATYVDGRAISRPMATLGIDANGTIWFMCKQDSQEAQQIKSNPRVHVTYSVHARSQYLALEGTATVMRDQKKIDELWTPFAKTWFPDGKDDPSIALVKFSPKVGHYWDTKHGKMVQLVGMVVGAVTGKETDDSLEGDLRV